MKYVFLFFLIIFIIFRYHQSKPKIVDGQYLRITDRVSSEPTKYDNSQGVVLSGVRIYLPRFPEINYGDEIVVEGMVEEGKIKKGRLIKTVKKKNGLLNIRERLISFYQKALPQPHSSLVAGVTLGSKSGISTEFWEKLKASGTIHVVVASGMNVTLVANFLMSVLVLVLPRRKAVPLALGGIWLYSILSGMDAPIVRAAIMGSIAFGALSLGKIYIATRGLLISALLMLLIKPLWLTDLGFILSFVATASLMLFERRVHKLVRFVPGIFREGLSTSLAAQIGVAPILFVTFGQFNFLSPIANALSLWTIPPITILGGMAGIVGLFSFEAGRLLALLNIPLTSWFLYIVNVFS